MNVHFTLSLSLNLLSLSLFVQTCSQMNFTQTQHTVGHTHTLAQNGLIEF